MEPVFTFLLTLGRSAILIASGKTLGPEKQPKSSDKKFNN